MSHTLSTIPDVAKSVTVDVAIDTAFTVFTTHMSLWWPPTHKILPVERVGVVMQPKAGGRYFEWGTDGDELDWGRVEVFHPLSRVELTWRIGRSFQHLPAEAPCSRIVVTFSALSPERTEVHLIHTDFEALGAEDGEWLRSVLDGPSPGETLGLYATAVAKLTN